MPVLNDDVIREMYREYNIPCDTLISDHTQLHPFAEDYVQRTGHAVELAQLARRLLTLRKLGEAKGGLPRLRRSYNGRN